MSTLTSVSQTIGENNLYRGWRDQSRPLPNDSKFSYSQSFDDPTQLSFKIEFGNWGNSLMTLAELQGSSSKGTGNVMFATNKVTNVDYDEFPCGLFDVNWAEKSTLSTVSGFNSTAYYNAVNYLYNRNEDTRAEYLKAFITGILDIQKNYPYIFKSISGINTLLDHSATRGSRLSKEAKLTLTCYEGLDLKIKTLLNYYRKAAWDDVWQRWMLPDIYRSFKMIIYISEAKRFHAISTKSNNYVANAISDLTTKVSNSTTKTTATSETNVYSFKLDNLEADPDHNILPMFAFECCPCEIDLNSPILGSDYDSGIESKDEETKISIIVSNVKFYETNPLFEALGNELSGHFIADLMSQSGRTDIGTSTWNIDNMKSLWMKRAYFNNDYNSGGLTDTINSSIDRNTRPIDADNTPFKALKSNMASVDVIINNEISKAVARLEKEYVYLLSDARYQIKTGKTREYNEWLYRTSNILGNLPESIQVIEERIARNMENFHIKDKFYNYQKTAHVGRSDLYDDTLNLINSIIDYYKTDNEKNAQNSYQYSQNNVSLNLIRSIMDKYKTDAEKNASQSDSSKNATLNLIYSIIDSLKSGSSSGSAFSKTAEELKKEKDDYFNAHRDVLVQNKLKDLTQDEQTALKLLYDLLTMKAKDAEDSSTGLSPVEQKNLAALIYLARDAETKNSKGSLENERAEYINRLIAGLKAMKLNTDSVSLKMTSTELVQNLDEYKKYEDSLIAYLASVKDSLKDSNLNLTEEQTKFLEYAKQMNADNTKIRNFYYSYIKELIKKLESNRQYLANVNQTVSDEIDQMNKEKMSKLNETSSFDSSKEITDAMNTSTAALTTMDMAELSKKSDKVTKMAAAEMQDTSALTSVEMNALNTSSGALETFEMPKVNTDVSTMTKVEMAKLNTKSEALKSEALAELNTKLTTIKTIQDTSLMQLGKVSQLLIPETQNLDDVPLANLVAMASELEAVTMQMAAQVDSVKESVKDLSMYGLKDPVVPPAKEIVGGHIIDNSTEKKTLTVL